MMYNANGSTNVNGNGMYSGHNHQLSYDAATASTSNSSGTDQWGNSTDPSSENSSNDRIHQILKPESGENYGLNGFGTNPNLQGPILEDHHYGSPMYGQPGYGNLHKGNGAKFAYQGNDMPPPPPTHGLRQSPPKTPIKLSTPNNAPAYSSPASRPQVAEKRKSWLKRTFSKG